MKINFSTTWKFINSSIKITAGIVTKNRIFKAITVLKTKFEIHIKSSNY